MAIPIIVGALGTSSKAREKDKETGYQGKSRDNSIVKIG